MIRIVAAFGLCALSLIPLVEYESHNVFNKRVHLGSPGSAWPAVPASTC